MSGQCKKCGHDGCLCDSPMSDTPETDKWTGLRHDIHELCATSRRLERERDRYLEMSDRIYKLEEELQEAREYADRLVEHKDMVCLPADLANLREANTAFAIENHDLKKQRDEYKKALRSAESHNHEMLVSLEKSREQRDRLAEALQKLADCDWVITLPDRMDAVRDIARDALKGGSDES